MITRRSRSTSTWNVTVPQKIKRYREVGYIESDHHASAGAAGGVAP